MKNQRGQATVLIGIIFQLVFIFFAMVINVGLLVNDKINLQNSVDIAAYYGAMKQAEVLNTIGHINFQIRQAWKLFNWRLWALGDAGRVLNVTGNNALDLSNLPDESFSESFDFPLVCIRNSLWWDEHFTPGGQPQTPENWCKKATFSIPTLKPLVLRGFLATPFFGSLRIYEAISQINASNYGRDCNRGGADNFYFATLILANYKISVAHRRNAIRNLQKLLISSTNNFTDISGQPVKDTVKAVLTRNLTLANKEQFSDDSFEFYNSLGGQPFLVPIDTRVFLQYLDISGDNNNCKGETKNLTQKPQTTSDFASQMFSLAADISASDVGKEVPVQDAQMFANEDSGTTVKEMRSLVGFEKNPWIAAYVRVRATTQPRMLFTPWTKPVTLTAEGIAMPFGGRIGPSYRTTWPRQSIMSAGATKTDALLSPRIGEPFGTEEGKKIYSPNYSRYPGDKLGMKSQQARVLGLKFFNPANVEGLPHLRKKDYSLILQGLADESLKQDPLVSGDDVTRPIRRAEILAIAPDLFDATYYPIDANFNGDRDSSMVKKNGNVVLSQTCKFGCEDLGSTFSGQTQYWNVGKQIEVYKTDNTAYWKLVNVDHLRTGWAQKAANDYTGAADLVGISPEKNPIGGRVGYSVKIVSDDFLRRSLPWGGQGGGTGVIKNPPP